MARHTGKGGIVKKGGTVIGGLRNWSITELVQSTGLAAAGDTYTPKAAGIVDWNGSAEFLLDIEETAQDLRPGDFLDVEFFSDGDGTGKRYYSGNLLVVDAGVSSPYDGEVTQSYSFEGNSVLTIGTVS